MREQIDWKQELLDSANFNGKQEKFMLKIEEEVRSFIGI